MKYGEIDWRTFVELGKKLIGKPYVMGAEVDLTDGDVDHIKAIDCSELVEFLYAQVGLYIADGSYNQIKYVRTVPKDDVRTGDIGFKANPENGVIHHVGVYLGDGQVLEAKGKTWGTILTPRETYEASPHFLQWGRHKLIDEEAQV